MLSDGHINGGISDPGTLMPMFGELMGRGISTTTIGLSDGSAIT